LLSSAASAADAAGSLVAKSVGGGGNGGALRMAWPLEPLPPDLSFGFFWHTFFTHFTRSSFDTTSCSEMPGSNASAPTETIALRCPPVDATCGQSMNKGPKHATEGQKERKRCGRRAKEA